MGDSKKELEDEFKKSDANELAREKQREHWAEPLTEREKKQRENFIDRYRDDRDISSAEKSDITTDTQENKQQARNAGRRG